jgi:hypothetical protein
MRDDENVFDVAFEGMGGDEPSASATDVKVRRERLGRGQSGAVSVGTSGTQLAGCASPHVTGMSAHCIICTCAAASMTGPAPFTTHAPCYLLSTWHTLGMTSVHHLPHLLIIHPYPATPCRCTT